MSLRTWVRQILQPKPVQQVTRTGQRLRLGLESLEDRWVPTIYQNVILGGTLDINPISSIFPSSGFTALEIQLGTVPGTINGLMSKISGGTTIIPWGSSAPTAFKPVSNGNENRIFSGEGFRYQHTGTTLGVSDSIPIRFRDSTGFNTLTDTLVINVVSPAGAPTITQQPQSLQSIAAGTSASFSVVASGTGSLSYQWFTGISPNTQFPIAGATGTSYTTPPLAASAGDYYYWVRVSNGITSAASTTAAVKVGIPPTANAGGPYSASEGGTAQLSGTGTDPNNGIFLLYEWDLDNDGIFGESASFASNGNENLQNPVFRAIDGSQTWPIKLRVTNDRGLSAIASTTVNISNVSPSNLQLTAPSQVSLGQSFTLSGSFTDPGTLDSFTVRVNWGDGTSDTVLNLSAGQNSFSVNKTYNNGYSNISTYNLQLTVTDKDGGTNSFSRAISVPRNNQLTVTTTADEDNGTSDPAFGAGTSLREALRYAEAKPGADTITFAPGLNGQTLTLTQGWDSAADDTALRIFGDATIDGGNQITLAVGTGPKRRHILSGGGTFTLRNITLRDGDLTGVQTGGAIFALGGTVIDNVLFLNNKAVTGGAIHVTAGGNATITNSRFENNSVTFEGGAIENLGTLSVNNSTFTANRSDFKGGALRLFGTAAITRSTFTGNTAVTDAGALVSFGTLTVTSSTFADNGKNALLLQDGTADLRHLTVASNRDGGLARLSADVTLRNSIVAGNAGLDVSGTLNAASSNNLINMTAAAAGIGTLANNGGPTQTIAPLPGSPAVNAAIAMAGIDLDQRGLPRVAAGLPDIGAVEVQTTAPKVTSYKVLYGNGRSFELIGATRVNLPWAITGIQVTFDQAVTGTAGSLAGLAVGSVTGSGTATLTWTLAAPVLTAVVATQLAATGTNALRNQWGVALDGTNAGGAGGTAYARSLRILAGDFDDDGAVTINDAVKVRNLIGSSNPFADVNGDGTIDLHDVNFVRSRIGARLL
jgi:CSLREA domain-containing protein